jgi:hypothetical protein
MHWGSSLYVYPIEDNLVEYYDRPPRPAQMIEARMFGGRWRQEGDFWKLMWTEQAVKDFYLNNILIHELGHLLDDRNSSYADRERYAEWFALQHGYLATAHERRLHERPVTRRHAKRKSS